MTFVLPRRLPVGTRNDRLTRRAGQRRRYGATESEILADIRIANSERSVEPLEDRELRQIARSVARYPPAQLDSPIPRRRDPIASRRRRAERLLARPSYPRPVRISPSRFSVAPRRGGGKSYVVDVEGGSPACPCPDRRSGRSGTCLHIEIVRTWATQNERAWEGPR